MGDVYQLMSVSFYHPHVGTRRYNASSTLIGHDLDFLVREAIHSEWLDGIWNLCISYKLAKEGPRMWHNATTHQKVLEGEQLKEWVQLQLFKEAVET